MAKEKSGAMTIRCVVTDENGSRVTWLSRKTVSNTKYMKKYGIRVEDEKYTPAPEKAPEKKVVASEYVVDEESASGEAPVSQFAAKAVSADRAPRQRSPKAPKEPKTA